MASTPPRPKNIGVILFPGFQLLDITGPLDVLNLLANTHALNLSIIASTLSPVSTSHAQSVAAGSNFSQSIVPTHTFATAPDDIEVLIIPGGFGSRKEENIEGVVQFVRERYPSLKWLLTVCTGSAIVAKSGILDGRRATSNKKAFAWVCFSLSSSWPLSSFLMLAPSLIVERCGVGLMVHRSRNRILLSNGCLKHAGLWMEIYGLVRAFRRGLI